MQKRHISHSHAHTHVQVIHELKKHIEPDRAHVLSSFFKPGKGQYGEGDTFIGVAVPNTRRVARTYIDLDLKEIAQLLEHKIHEVRLCALIILSLRVLRLYKKKKMSKEESQVVYREHKKIVDLYLKHMRYINNWDLVDTSAYHIYGSFLFLHHPKDMLQILAKHARSKNIWERRIAIISTLFVIRTGTSLEIVTTVAEMLLGDREDLIHKAVGWMLREMGKKDKGLLTGFLDQYAGIIPRTALRYAIERLKPKERTKYMRQSKAGGV